MFDFKFFNLEYSKKCLSLERQINRVILMQLYNQRVVKIINLFINSFSCFSKTFNKNYSQIIF